MELQPRERRGSTPDELKRLRSVEAMLREARYLPLSWREKKAVLATQAMSKLAYGWMTRLPNKVELKRIEVAISFALREQLQASVPLRKMLRGHSLDPLWRVLWSNVSAAWRLARTTGGCPCPWSSGGWVATIERAFDTLGWRGTGEWTWHHAAMDLTQTLDSQQGLAPSKLFGHHMRESWRRMLWTEFITSNRRDAQALHNVPYDTVRVKHARKAFQEQGAHCRAVMSGAAVSDARFMRMRNLPVQSCGWCNQPDVPSWEHVTWNCSAFAESRQDVRPQDALHRILGWPTGPQDGACLRHLGAVRQALTDQRQPAVNPAGMAPRMCRLSDGPLYMPWPWALASRKGLGPQ